MATPQPRWEILDEPEQKAAEAERAFAEGQEHERAAQLLALGLKTLSQRALAALADLFCLITVIGVWYLWHSIPDPNPNQIVALTIFAAFVLVANWLVRRK